MYFHVSSAQSRIAQFAEKSAEMEAKLRSINRKW